MKLQRSAKQRDCAFGRILKEQETGYLVVSSSGGLLEVSAAVTWSSVINSDFPVECVPASTHPTATDVNDAVGISSFKVAVWVIDFRHVVTQRLSRSVRRYCAITSCVAIDWPHGDSVVVPMTQPSLTGNIDPMSGFYSSNITHFVHQSVNKYVYITWYNTPYIYRSM